MTSPRRHLAALLALLLTAAAVAAVASASTPSSGTVSKSAPSISWAGTLISGGSSQIAFENDPTAPCQSPSCDSFALKVADAGGTLTITENLQSQSAAGGDGTGGIRLTTPDGKQTYTEGDSGPKTSLKVVVKNAPAGDYTVDLVASFVCCTPTDYKAAATLAFAGGTPAPAPSTTPAPGGGGTQPGTGTQTASPTLKVTGPAKASAAKLSRSHKLRVALSSTGPLTKVHVILTKGKKQIGQGTLAALNGKGTVTLKLKGKLKKGSYGIAAGGFDAQGRSVVAGRKLAVKK